MNDLIDRQAAIDAIQKERHEAWEDLKDDTEYRNGYDDGFAESMRILIDDLPSAQPEIVRCKECKHFYYDMPYVIQGIPVLGHEVCDFWGDGCKTSENGFCSYAERVNNELV